MSSASPLNAFSFVDSPANGKAGLRVLKISMMSWFVTVPAAETLIFMPNFKAFGLNVFGKLFKGINFFITYGASFFQLVCIFDDFIMLGPYFLVLEVLV